MNRLAEALQSIAATLWVGGMWAVGYVVAPVLFSRLGDRALAGLIAGKLFSLIAWIGIACAASCCCSACCVIARWPCGRAHSGSWC